jgi:group I intron endonuclease
MKVPNKPGIYQLQSKANPIKIYIGSAINLRRRKNEHLRRMTAQSHCNNILLNHVNKYGIKDLEFTVLEIIENTDLLIIAEQFYIDKLNPHFNICKVAGSSKGRAWTEAAKLKRKLNRERKIRETGIDPNKPKGSSKKKMSKAASERYGELKPIENMFKIIGLVDHDGDKRRVNAECPHCKQPKEYDLQTLRKRKRHDCGCIKTARSPIPLIPREFHKPRLKPKTSYAKRSDNSSGWSGVTYDKAAKLFRSTVKHQGKLLNTGRASCPTLAVIARDKYIIENRMTHPTQIILSNIKE